jgi:hypothetical protein
MKGDLLPLASPSALVEGGNGCYVCYVCYVMYVLLRYVWCATVNLGVRPSPVPLSFRGPPNALCVSHH